MSIVLAILFVVFMIGQTMSGLYQYNDERRERGQPSVTIGVYLKTGHFIEATAENWESEFLQMAAYVLLTVGLFQKGSAESKQPNAPEAVDRDPRDARNKSGAPWPVRHGGWVLRLYENSLSIAFVVLFLISVWLHAVGGAEAYDEEQLARGEETVTAFQYLTTSKFWFESFQNWQSEFLSLVCMVVLSIYLRQRGSPESKPVDAPHDQTGSE